MSDIFLSVDGDTRPLEAKLGKISSKGINFNLKDGISQPLGKISGNVSEFNKSLEASNARVLAFGASAGAVYGITRAFKEMITATIEVEKSLADINVVLNASSADLSKFGSELFNIAKNTGQSFGEVAKAATELSRQGLGITETLKRTSDALILTRLSGLDAASSVQTLTAAVNGFARAGLTTTEIINKFATVDAAFAVSTADLANGLSRVGSAAQDAGVNIDELVALITSAQQNTARGGAVIGNAFKTIFTRLQRTDTLDKLEDTGVAVRDLQGNTLPAIQILKNLSDVFYKLSDAQRASIAETVGGVFQINVLKAALGDLSKEYSVYDNALRISSTSTNQAIKRNEALNSTLSALVNKTFVNLKQTGANVGEITIAPSIKKGASLLNPLLEGFNKEGDSQSAGVKVAKGILTGLGTYLSGPGLALVGAVFLKIFGGLTAFSADALKGLLGITNASDKIAQAQTRITSILAQNPALIQAIISKDTSLLQVENQILSIIQAQNAARSAATRVAVGLAPKVAFPTAATAKTGKTKSGGFVPNFSSEMQEIMGAKEGGYTPGSIRGMNISGEGNIIYNSAESVVNYPGAKQPAIVPPENSKAGKDYRKKFQNKAGFDPYAAGGFVPNFAERDKKISIQDSSAKSKARGNQKTNIPIKSQSKVGMIIPVKSQGWSTTYGEAIFGDHKVKIGFPVAGYSPSKVRKPSDVDLEKQLGDNLVRFTNSFADKLFAGTQNSARISSVKQLSNWGSLGSVVGTVFETAVGVATQSMQEGRGANDRIDFDPPNDKLRKLFNNMPAQAYEAKNSGGQNQKNSTAKKILDLGYVDKSIYNELGSTYEEKVSSERYQYLSRKGKYGPLNRADKNEFNRLGRNEKNRRAKNAASGFIPNFSAVQDAIQREKDAGVDSNRIRVDSNDSLISKNNPLGLGVYNTKDEPHGLKQGIDRVKSKGFVPNFADPKDDGSGQYQSRLLAVSISLSVLQGVISQFSDQTSQSAKNLQQLTMAAANLTTGLGISKKFGGLIAGGLLMNQANSMREESSSKPYTEALTGLNKEIDSLRAESGKLEGVFSKVKEQTNAYSEELDKAFPDATKIQDFRSNILDALSTLGPELRQKIMDQMPAGKMYDKETPGNITNTFGRSGADIALKMDMKSLTSDLVTSSLQTSKAQSSYDGLFSKGVRKLTGDKSERPTNEVFQNKNFAEGASSSIIGNIMSDSSKATAEGLLSVAASLKESNKNGNSFVETLQSLSPKTAETNRMFQALNSTLSQSPQAIGKLRESILDDLEKLLAASQNKIAAAIKGGQGSTKEQYGDVTKLFNGKTLATPQGNGKQILDLMATSGETAMYRDRQDPLMQGRAAGGFLQQLNSLGISSDKLKEFAPDLVKSNEVSNEMDIKKTMEEVIAGLKRASKDFTPEKEKAFREKFGGDTGLFSKVGQQKAGAALTSGTFGPVEASLENLKTVTIEASTELPALTSEFKLLEEAVKSLKNTINENKNAPPTFDPSKARAAGDTLEGDSKTAAGAGNTQAKIIETLGVASSVLTIGAALKGGGKMLMKGMGKLGKGGKAGGKVGALLTGGALLANLLGGSEEEEGKETNTKELTNTLEETSKKSKTPKINKGILPSALATAKKLKIPGGKGAKIPGKLGGIGAITAAITSGAAEKNNFGNTFQELGLSDKFKDAASIEAMNRGYEKLSKISKVKKSGVGGGVEPGEFDSVKKGTVPDALSKAENNKYNVRDSKGRFSKIPPASNLSKMSKMAKVAKSGFGKSNLLLNLAFSGMAFKNSLDEGYSPGQAALITGGGLLGGLLGGAAGGAVGSLAGPVGTVGGGIGGSMLGAGAGEWLGKFLAGEKANPSENIPEAAPIENGEIGGGTLMTENGVSVGPKTEKINEELSKKFGQFNMGSTELTPEQIPEISRPAPSKFEKLQSHYQNLEKVQSQIGGESRIADPRGPSELMKGMTDEQQHNAQVMSLENIMGNNASEKGYTPRDYGEKIAPYKRAIDELEGGQSARYGEFEPGKGFKKLGGFVGNYEKTRRKQMSKGFSTRNARTEEQRKTGFIDSGFEKGYATFGADNKLTPETQVTSRNYDNETGMIRQQTNEGNVGLESSVLQDEKKIFLDQMSKKYDKKTSSSMLESLMNQKGKDKNKRTGFQNLQAHNRVNSPSVAAPQLKGPEFLKENMPMYGQNLQAGLLFGKEQTTDPNKSLMSEDYIASSKSFDRTKEYNLNTDRKTQSNMPFAQYDNPKEYMPPKDFYQPSTALEGSLAEAQGSLSQIPMGMMSQKKMESVSQFAPQQNNMLGLSDNLGFNKNLGDGMLGGGLSPSQGMLGGGLGAGLGAGLGGGLGTSFGQGMFGGNDMKNQMAPTKSFQNDLQQVLEPPGGGAGMQKSQDRGIYERQEKTNLAVSPTNPELKMQEQPKEKSKGKKEDEQGGGMAKIFGSLNKEMSNFSEKLKTAAESLGKMGKEGSKEKEGKDKSKEGEGKKEEVKINDIKASVTITSTPDTKTEAKVAAISKVIEELKKELEQLKGKVTNKVNPPSAMKT